VSTMNDGLVRRSHCSCWTLWDCAALDCHTVRYCCRGRWPLTTARSHLPDSPPDFTAWDCSPLLPFVTCAGLDKERQDLPRSAPGSQDLCPSGMKNKRACTIVQALYLCLVPEAGVEPAYPRGCWILSPVRLPISPLRHKLSGDYNEWPAAGQAGNIF
jgi:hypothetical protein